MRTRETVVSIRDIKNILRGYDKTVKVVQIAFDDYTDDLIIRPYCGESPEFVPVIRDELEEVLDRIRDDDEGITVGLNKNGTLYIEADSKQLKS